MSTLDANCGRLRGHWEAIPLNEKNGMLGATNHKLLHLAQPVRYGSRVKPHASSHSERRDSAGGCLLIHGKGRHTQEASELLRGNRSTDPLDFVREGHS